MIYELLQGIRSSLIECEVSKTLRDIDLIDKANTFAKHLSGGEKRKLSVGIAVIGDPRVCSLKNLTAWSLKANSRSLRFPAYYNMWRFITKFTRATYWTLTSPHPHNLLFLINLILSYHLRLSLPCGIFASDVLSRILCTFLLKKNRYYYMSIF